MQREDDPWTEGVRIERVREIESLFASNGRTVEVTDYAGRVRKFNLQASLTVGFVVTAKESAETSRGTPGYEFSAFSYTSAIEALHTLRKKMQAALATRNLAPNQFPALLTDQCTGRIEAEGLVVDGEFISWSALCGMLERHEGSEFILRIVTP